MLVVFGILIIVASVILGFIVLIQNPKGGGVSGVLGGFSNQLIGVKQSTDVMEKGTWVFAAIVGILCIISPAFIPKDGSSSSVNDDLRKNMNPKQQQSAPAPAPAPTPATTVPMQGTDTPKKQ
jgi:preprotein translocase subunit SecG